MIVLPLVGVGVPVRLAQAAGLQVEDHAGHRGGDRELAGADPPLLAAGERGVGLLGQQADSGASGGRVLAALVQRRGSARRDAALDDVQLPSWGTARRPMRAGPAIFESTSGGVWPSQSVLLKVPNSEKAPSSKIRMKWASSGPSPWSRWPCPRGKYQTSPGSKSFISEVPSGPITVVRTRPLIDERPLGGDGVPVQLADAAGVEPHRDARQPLGDRQLLDRRLLGRSALGPCGPCFSSIAYRNVGSSSEPRSCPPYVLLRLVGRGGRCRPLPRRPRPAWPSPGNPSSTGQTSPSCLHIRVMPRSVEIDRTS